MDDVPMLVIAPQYEWGANATITGNFAGLISLYKAMKTVIEGESQLDHFNFDVFAPDGEGFTVEVSKANGGNIPTAYSGLPAEIDAARFRVALQKIAEMSADNPATIIARDVLY